MRDDARDPSEPRRGGERLAALQWEELARHAAGQACEVWEVNGGAEQLWGFTVLWIPTEHVFWAFNAGKGPAWYFSPFSREMTLQCLADWETHHYFTRLEGYVPVSTVCQDCHRPLTAEERDFEALSLCDFGMSSPQCMQCVMRF